MNPAWRKRVDALVGPDTVVSFGTRAPQPDGVAEVTVGGRNVDNADASAAEYAHVNGQGPFHIRNDRKKLGQIVTMAQQFSRPLPWLNWLASDAVNTRLTNALDKSPENVIELASTLVKEYAAKFAALANPVWRADALCEVFGGTASIDDTLGINTITLCNLGTAKVPVQSLCHELLVRKIIEGGNEAVLEMDNQAYLLWILSRQKFYATCRRTKAQTQLEPASVCLCGPKMSVTLVQSLTHRTCCPRPTPVIVNIVELARGAAAANESARTATCTETIVQTAAARPYDVRIVRLFSVNGKASISQAAQEDVFSAGARAYLVGASGLCWAMRDVLATRGVITATVSAGALYKPSSKTAAGSQMAQLFDIVAPHCSGDRQGVIAQLESATRSTTLRAPKPCLPVPPQYYDNLRPADLYGGPRTKEFVCVYSNPEDRMQASTCNCKPGDTPATIATKSAASAFGTAYTTQELAQVLPPCMVKAMRDPSGYWKRWELAMNCRDAIFKSQ